jgi:hypothetical protein
MVFELLSGVGDVRVWVEVVDVEWWKGCGWVACGWRLVL